jgi:hypothetical protein
MAGRLVAGLAEGDQQVGAVVGQAPPGHQAGWRLRRRSAEPGCVRGFLGASVVRTGTEVGVPRKAVSSRR